MGAPRTLRSLFPILLVGLTIVLLTTFLAGHTAHGPQAPKRAAGTSASTSSVSAKVAKVKTKAVAAVLPPAKRGDGARCIMPCHALATLWCAGYV